MSEPDRTVRQPRFRLADSQAQDFGVGVAPLPPATWRETRSNPASNCWSSDDLSWARLTSVPENCCVSDGCTPLLRPTSVVGCTPFFQICCPLGATKIETPSTACEPSFRSKGTRT